MKKTIYSLALFTLLFSFSCTSYQKEGFTGGYTDKKINTDMYRVTFEGNSFTDAETVHLYFLRRCSEVTLEEGYDYFSFVQENANNNSDFIVTEDLFLVTDSNSRQGIIKLFKEGNQPSVAINAREYLKNMEDD